MHMLPSVQKKNEEQQLHLVTVSWNSDHNPQHEVLTAER